MLNIDFEFRPAEDGTKVGGEFLGDNPCGSPPGKDGMFWACPGIPPWGGVLPPLEAGLDVVLKSLGGGEFVVGEDEDPR